MKSRASRISSGFLGGLAGAVTRLPRIERPDKAARSDVGAEPAPAWRDSLTTPRVLPEERLLQLESRQAARWIAERIAGGDWGLPVMRMTVIDVRDALIAFYQRRGYARTGIRKPFPYGDERFGTPLRDDLRFEVLEKALHDGGAA